MARELRLSTPAMAKHSTRKTSPRSKARIVTGISIRTCYRPWIRWWSNPMMTLMVMIRWFSLKLMTCHSKSARKYFRPIHWRKEKRVLGWAISNRWRKERAWVSQCLHRYRDGGKPSCRHPHSLRIWRPSSKWVTRTGSTLWGWRSRHREDRNETWRTGSKWDRKKKRKRR